MKSFESIASTFVRLPSMVLCALLCLAMPGCDRQASGSLGEGPRSGLPDNFQVLYGQNCAGCHGTAGTSGASIPLADPLYQALVDDETLREVISNGREGSHMPGFAESAGGTLTSAEIDSLVKGMRQRWAKLVNTNSTLPPYKARSNGDAQRGLQVYNGFCASCHGQIGQKAGKAGSIVDRSFLQVIDDQSLRTLVIIGRPDFNAPDWRGNVPGRPMTDQEITDVVAWLSIQRPQTTGVSAKQGGE